MNETEMFVAGAAILLFGAGIGWLVVALRKSRRIRRLWQRRA